MPWITRECVANALPNPPHRADSSSGPDGTEQVEEDRSMTERRLTTVEHNAFEAMEPDRAREVEDSLWWRVGRQSLLRDFLAHARRERPLERIAEIGCGSGADLDFLSDFAQVTGIEVSDELARRARERGTRAEILVGDASEIGARVDYDLMCLFDVLEHIEDDNAFVRGLSAVQRPGRLLLVSVPACAALFSPHDEMLHHYRRYSARGLASVLERNGYEVIRGRYFIFLLFPLVALARMKERFLAHIGRPPREVNVGEVPAWIGASLSGVLRFEAFILRYLTPPIGVWRVVLARRTPDNSDSHRFEHTGGAST